MGSGEHQRDRAGGQAQQPVAAQAVTEEHGLEQRFIDAAEHFGQPAAHAGLADVVQALGQELDVHLVDRAGHGLAHLAVENLTGDQLETQGRPPSTL